MEGINIKHIVTSITLARIIGAIILLFTQPLSVLFYIIYLICGISDVLDGYIARKTDTTSKSGAVLDSIADLILFAVILVLFIPILSWAWWMMYWITAIALIRVTSLIIGIVKYHALAFLHTNANKFAGITLFCFPVLYHLLELHPTAIILCGIASISSLEELIITLKSKELNRDIRSLFMK